jgi:hypothetical protein
MIQINLTQEEKDIVIAEAYRRQSENEKRSIKGRNGASAIGDTALRYHLIGAAGEMAVASFLDLKDYLYKEQIAIKGSSDLPGNIDVKTRSKHFYDLIVQLDDKPGKNYWLVTIEDKIIKIHGWLPWDQCMKAEYKKDPVRGRPAYFVPKSKLYDPKTWAV